jgi:hypothetical protein
MVLEVYTYRKEMLVTDLTNLVAYLDELDEKLEKIIPEI